MPIDTLLLDLGNVLAFHDNQKLFRDLSALFGPTSPDDFRARLDGGLWRRVNTGQLPGDALRRELCERLGVEVTREDFERAWNGHFTLNQPMIDRVESLVGTVRLVLLSNTHDLHIDWLRARLPVLQRFDALVLSCEVGAMKPDALMFETALQAAQAPAHRCAFFDDLPAFVEAAANHGISARLFVDEPGFWRDYQSLT